MILGLVAAKENSNRFPGKNKYIIENKPLFWYSVEPLLQSELIDDLYVVTDSDFIKNYCKKRNVKTIWRPKNATRDEDKLINILRFAYYSLDIEYDVVVSIMANCPNHDVKEINKGINLLIENKLNEVRSYNNGVESGLLILNKFVMQNNFDISYYVGSVDTKATEIHFLDDLNKNK